MKVRDWIKSKGVDTQFSVLKAVSNITVRAVRNMDGKIFEFITIGEPDKVEFYFHEESENTIKQEIGITKFYSDNIHVDISCFSKCLNSTNQDVEETIHAIEIDFIENTYAELLTKGFNFLLNIIKE